MPEAATGTLMGNVVQLDTPINLPDATRVSVTVLPLTPDRAESLAAWEATKARLREHPIHGVGKRFTRDELHERR